MLGQEVGCFAEMLACDRSQLTPHSLLKSKPSRSMLDTHDAVLIGGSGDFSAAGEGEWLERTFDALRDLHTLSKPTFGSCWGFQALCRALGGDCVHDLANAELGSIAMTLTDAGRDDPLFAGLPATFLGHSGHEDRVTDLPADAELLASSATVPQQAVRFTGKPIYATQFHPELTAKTFFERIAAYPKYVEQIAGVSIDEFRKRCHETPEANGLLRRFVDIVLA